MNPEPTNIEQVFIYFGQKYNRFDASLATIKDSGLDARAKSLIKTVFLHVHSKKGLGNGLYTNTPRHIFDTNVITLLEPLFCKKVKPNLISSLAYTMWTQNTSLLRIRSQ